MNAIGLHACIYLLKERGGGVEGGSGSISYHQGCRHECELYYREERLKQVKLVLEPVANMVEYGFYLLLLVRIP